MFCKELCKCFYMFLTLYRKSLVFTIQGNIAFLTFLEGGKAMLSAFSSLIFVVYHMLCTYPVIPSFVHVCIYFWFPLWLFLVLDSLLWNIVLKVSSPFYNLITRSYATNFIMNFLEVSLLL